MNGKIFVSVISVLLLCSMAEAYGPGQTVRRTETVRSGLGGMTRTETVQTNSMNGMGMGGMGMGMPGQQTTRVIQSTGYGKK